MGRRSKGEGTISKRKDKKGNVIGWCAALTVGYNPNGSQKRVFMYGKSQTEVKEKLDVAKEEHRKGILTDPSKGKMKVKEWFAKWLNERIKTEVRPTTWDSYKYIVDHHIIPAFGTLQLKNLTATHLYDLYNTKLESGRADGKGGLSSRTAKYILTVVHAGLKQAVKEKLVPHNVAVDVDLTKNKKSQDKQIRVLTSEEVDKFLKAIEGDRLYAAFSLSLSTGLRVGELLALRWSDADLKESEGVIHVRRGLVKIRNQEGNTKTKTVFQEPKSKKGKRDIPITDNIVKELKEHRKQQEEEMKGNEDYEENNFLVFCTFDGKPLEPRNFTRKFHSLIDKAGLPHTNLHALRHTFATRLMEAGVNPKVAQELLGHSDVGTTLNIYSHASMEPKREAVAKLLEFKKKKQPEQEKKPV